MMWEWGCAGLVVAAFVGWIVSRIHKYRRLYADEHYLEIAREVARLKVIALSAAEQSKFAERAVPKVSPAEITSFRREYLEDRRHLRWKRLE